MGEVRQHSRKDQIEADRYLDFWGVGGIPTGNAMEEAMKAASDEAVGLLDRYAPVALECERYSDIVRVLYNLGDPHGDANGGSPIPVASTLDESDSSKAQAQQEEGGGLRDHGAVPYVVP